MATKILIIDNSRPDFMKVKAKLENDFYTVLPEAFNGMADCIAVGGEKLFNYVTQQIDENYKELRLIICDIKLNSNDTSGDRMVETIRKHVISDFPKWTSLVPIIAITGYAISQVSIINAGANFSLNKDKINRDPDWFLAVVKQYITSFERTLEFMYPDELKDKIRLFREEHLNGKTAFIMTSFAEEHKSTIELIKSVLHSYNITPCLANKQGGEHNDYLWQNIEVFIHGCDFGIGIYADDSILKGRNEKEYKKRDKELFKRIRINPNMSQEVGYMLGLQKKVCILKDKKLDKLPTDLAGRIYVEYSDEFDLKKQLGEWITNKVLPKKTNKF